MSSDDAASFTWDLMRNGYRRGVAELALFAVSFGLLTALGYGLRDRSELLTLMWPAAGLLFIALWTAPMRYWWWLLAIQLSIQIAAYFLTPGPVHPVWGPMFALANAVGGLAGALTARQLVRNPLTPQVGQLLMLLVATALGSAAEATAGAYVSIHTSIGSPYFRQWQLWWAGSWLGSLWIAPVIICWAVRWRVAARTTATPPLPDLLLTGGVMLIATWWIFGDPPGVFPSLLKNQFVVLALGVVTAFRLPPRWSVTLNAMSALIVAYYSSRHLGPYGLEPDNFARLATVQLAIASLLVLTLMIGIALDEVRTALRRLGRSEARYRNFVEKSSEAMWQLELMPPMPLGLELQAQREWLDAHARVNECNLAYRECLRLFGVADADARRWRADLPWSAGYLSRLEEAALHGYSIDGLQFSLPDAGARRRTYLTGFTGVIVDGKVESIWGVARDISELVELNESLRQKQARVQMYSQQLAGAEERARRATAVDLHDGIGQQLIGLALTLDAAASRPPAELRLLLGEAAHTLRGIHAVTQRVIADLSPPGLYELGLEAALQWLGLYMRGKDDLNVQLAVNVTAVLDLELRILAFKLIRELLRNVVKHSGVRSAKVRVSNSQEQLFIDVNDDGVGFEWQLSLFENQTAGFGLWSVVQRITEAGGEIDVDTAPARGCAVSITLPLQPPHFDDQRGKVDGRTQDADRARDPRRTGG